MTAPDRTLERDIKAAILLALGRRPDVLAWNHPTGLARSLTPPYQPVTYGLVGSADIIGVLGPDGRAIAVEVKTATGRQSEQQRKFEAAFRRCGGLYILARSVDDALKGLL